MSMRSVQRVVGWAFLFCVLSACDSHFNPTVLDETPAPAGATPQPSSAPQECFVNFQSQLQLKVSAKPASDALEVLDANPITIPSIPIVVKGNEVAILGEKFPDIILTRLSNSADIRFGGVHGSKASGTFNPDTGEMNFDSMQFTLEVLTKGSTEPLLPGQVVLGSIHLTTGAVTANGNLHPIQEQGKPLNREDLSLTLVLGLTLPSDFSPLVPLNDILGGGALTANFSGKLDALPENCGSANPDNQPPPGQEQPPGLHISVEGQPETSRIDLGLASVVLKNLGGKPALDCSAGEFRGVLSKLITIKNTSSSSKTLKFTQPIDLDDDVKTPLCSGAAEFVRGSISMKAGATCKTVKVGGREYPLGECTLPNADSEISFPMMYVPFNYVDSPPGQDPPLDKGEFSLDYGAEKPFVISLSGRTIPDVRDVLSVSKINNGVISPREVKTKGSLKISLENAAQLPFTQKMVLKNTGTDAWEEVHFTFSEASAFSVVVPTENRLPASNENGPGLMEFDLVFNPGAATVTNDVVEIHMVKVGSRTEENPIGIEARIKFNLVGTVGIPKLTGNMRLQFDFLTALIDHSVIDEPLTTIDYRQQPELAPEPLRLRFSDADDPAFQNVELDTNVVDILDPDLSLADRIKVLRIFTSRASVGLDGQRLGSGDGSDKCSEPTSLLAPYHNGDCSYFYHNILSSEVGLFDSESGQFTLPGIILQMQNPYHADILGRWPASNPGGNPDYLMDITLSLAFTTHLLDRRSVDEGGQQVVLVPDGRVSETELVLKDKRLGSECPTGYLDEGKPSFRCYLSAGDRYLQGYEATLRAGQTKYYDVVLVGAAQFPSGGPGTSNPDLPWFLGDSGGSRIYIAIQGRLYKADD